MNGTYTLIRLVATTIKDSNKIATCEYDIITNSTGYVMRNYDVYDQLHLHITLPALENGQYWKNNLLVHLIKNITVTLYTVFEETNYQYNFDNNYIKNIINNRLPNYCNNLLFRNLSVEKRIKKSTKEQTLILPLLNFIPLFIIATGRIQIDVEFFDSGFVENVLDDMPKINYDVYGLGYMYDTNPRRKMQKYTNSFKNKEDYDAFIEKLDIIVDDKENS